MCGTDPNLTPKANCAKNLGVTNLVLGVIGLIAGFAGLVFNGWILAIASILMIIAGSILCCCAPKEAGPGSGGKFCGASALGCIAAGLNFIAVAVSAGIYVYLVSDAPVQECITGECDTCVCSDANWANTYCTDGTSDGSWQLCASKDACQSSSYVESQCQTGVAIVTALIVIFFWPVVLFGIVNGILSLCLGVFAAQAKSEMEAATPPNGAAATVVAASGGVTVVQGVEGGKV